ncbi:MAG: hypothetical protein A2161_03770 [Candidatus Schekmanbacteria bacterium RBG_13_48_7]|uniref:DUF3341 domain-containing protein n=1 Tax=Candidatus Schekmanbacteria bacterium RBG_13_48_7 TaxID=1817878 RepID=A0A1F7S701_9BACT|nr:MAG: hypothetical protein A2161_03770 [Candidatus Schekmanbacteria bacterium RBG_13_48_7]
MIEEFVYDSRTDFIDKLKDLISSGIESKDISVNTPYPVHEIEEILQPPPDVLKYFTFSGAITGLIAGFVFTVYTALSWPLITGGKPIVSIPAFLIIAFALTILFGALASFAGFLVLSKLPDLKNIFNPKDFGNQFVIFVDHREQS